MNETADPTQPSAPCLGSRRDFGIAIALVVLTLTAGFLGFKPESKAKMLTAITFCIYIFVAFIMRREWARQAAAFVAVLGVLVAVFGGILTVNDAINPTDIERTTAWIQLLTDALTIHWLGRVSVKAWFQTPAKAPPKIN